MSENYYSFILNIENTFKSPDFNSNGGIGTSKNIKNDNKSNNHILLSMNCKTVKGKHDTAQH